MIKIPKRLDVTDKSNGFTAITRSNSYIKVTNEKGKFVKWEKKMVEMNTLWRPISILSSRGISTIGELQEVDRNSFFQNNNDVTKAIYKVKGYSYRVAVWFNNKTGERIA